MSDITVVIPVYNVEKYLRKCVDSVEKQTYKNFEVILVDDGSTDSSSELCDALAKENDNIRVIHQENRGLGGARNTGIESCNTEYIMFLDSDDYIHPELLKKCMDVLKKNNCDIVLLDMISVNEQGEKGILYSVPCESRKILSETERGGLCLDPSACNKIYKTALFKDNGIYYPNKVWYEDLRTTPKLLVFAERVMKLESEPLYYYLQRSDSIMHTPDYDRIVRERMAAAEDLYAFFKERSLVEEYSEMLEFIVIYHAFLLPCLEMYRKSGNYKKYLDILLQNLKEKASKPLENPYLRLLRKNELTVLKLALKRKYCTIKRLTLLNRLIKEVRNA